MEIPSENETKNKTESTGSGDGALSEKELDQVSGGDQSPKETITFGYGRVVIEYNQQKP